MTDHTINRSPRPTSPDCVRCAEQLSAYLEGNLAETERVIVTQHTSACDACGALLRDLDEIVTAAAALPPLSPSRDLWTAIEPRLASSVIDLGTRNTAQRGGFITRTVSVRQFAAAAAFLVAASSAVTWRFMRTQPALGVAPVELAVNFNTPVVPSVNALTAADTVMPVAFNTVPANYDATALSDADDVYLQQIAGLRGLVDARFADLDSVTVSELRRNLAIIDQAIADSRRALARSPKNQVLSSQLDRALQTKLALMRRVALL